MNMNTVLALVTTALSCLGFMMSGSQFQDGENKSGWGLLVFSLLLISLSIYCLCRSICW